MILGIDPGPTRSAFCMWDGEKIRLFGTKDNNSVANELVKLDGSGTVVGCEHLQCFGMAVGKDVFETAYWVGDFRATCREFSVPFVRVYRGQVKMHHCQSMRAKDSNIRQALIDRFGPPGTKKAPGLTYGLKGDEWSAFAIAVMVADKGWNKVEAVA